MGCIDQVVAHKWGLMSSDFLKTLVSSPVPDFRTIKVYSYCCMCVADCYPVCEIYCLGDELLVLMSSLLTMHLFFICYLLACTGNGSQFSSTGDGICQCVFVSNFRKEQVKWVL